MSNLLKVLIAAAVLLFFVSCLLGQPRPPITVPDADSPAKGKHLTRARERKARVFKGRAPKPRVVKAEPRKWVQGDVTITEITENEGRRRRHGIKARKIMRRFEGVEYHQIPVEAIQEAFGLSAELAQVSLDISAAMAAPGACDEIAANRKRGRRFSHNYKRKVKRYSTDEYLAADSQDLAEIYGTPVAAVEAIKRAMTIRKKEQRGGKAGKTPGPTGGRGKVQKGGGQGQGGKGPSRPAPAAAGPVGDASAGH